jgi:hypothetical protein
MSSAAETREWWGCKFEPGPHDGASLAPGRLGVDVCCHEPAAHLTHLLFGRGETMHMRRCGLRAERFASATRTGSLRATSRGAV